MVIGKGLLGVFHEIIWLILSPPLFSETGGTLNTKLNKILKKHKNIYSEMSKMYQDEKIYLSKVQCNNNFESQ